jgi:hypothetical protein
VKTPRKQRSIGILDLYGFESGASGLNVIKLFISLICGCSE